MTIVSLSDRFKTYFYYSVPNRAERFAARRWMKINGFPPTFSDTRGIINVEEFNIEHAKQLKEYISSVVK